jgi:hypothetical protein
MSKFSYFHNLYQKNKFEDILQNEDGIYWLKLRSLSRKNILHELYSFSGIECPNLKFGDLFKKIYEIHPQEIEINRFIQQEYLKERELRRKDETTLISELCKVKTFDWGGLYQNNLDKVIVDNYVKKITSYDLLNKKIENDIHDSMRNYVISSWYNHWTSILIEDIFKDHQKVTPTIGRIKKVDFFIENIPFDLKVTYFPIGYLAKKRKDLKQPAELAEMKSFARKINFKYNRKQKPKDIYNELLTRFNESENDEIRLFVQKLNTQRWNIISASIKKPQELITWLYEQQGERRFDSANRLFLILVDRNYFFDSWKMKRNIELLRGKINNYLDILVSSEIQNRKIEFVWGAGNKYTAVSDILFVIKNGI